MRRPAQASLFSLSDDYSTMYDVTFKGITQQGPATSICLSALAV
jgi:hypothetical protein